MQCDEIREMLSAYIDEALEPAEMTRVANHIGTCSSCQKELQELQETVKLLQSMGEIESPEGFRKELMKRLEKESAPDQKSQKRKDKIVSWFSGSRKYLAAAVLIIGLGISIGVYTLNSGSIYDLASQQSNSLNSADSGIASEQKAKLETGQAPSLQSEGAPVQNFSYKMDSANQAAETSKMTRSSETPQASGGSAGDQSLTMKAPAPSNAGIPNYNQKIIKEAGLSLEVNKYTQFESKLTALVEQYNGYIENSAENSGESVSANLLVRVPVANFSRLLDQISSLGKVTNKQISGQDVTGEYTDTEARLRNLQRQEVRLLALVDKAQSLSDVLTLESELSRVRGDIEVFQGRLKTLDNTTTFSVIRIDVKEVLKQKIAPPQGVFTKAIQNFRDSAVGLINTLGDLVAFLGLALPWIILIGSVIAAIYYLLKRKKKFKT